MQADFKCIGSDPVKFIGIRNSLFYLITGKEILKYIKGILFILKNILSSFLPKEILFVFVIPNRKSIFYEKPAGIDPEVVYEKIYY